MKLILKEEPKEEIVTLAEAKNYLRVNHDFDDELIQMFIKSTRIAMESIVQKSIIAQTWQYIIEDCSEVCKSHLKRDDVIHASQGKITIPLPKSPVVDILSVKMKGRKIESQSYTWDLVKDKYSLTINCRDLNSSQVGYPIVIKYRAGITDKAENVPYQIKLANLMLLANAYQERYSFSQKTLISQSVKEMLMPFFDLRFF